ncbi:MAG: sensor histidine kinase [Methylocystis sp.]|uniref:sensor histidine kinase n=1 Tax=Methylocystis sp. TaxID=1911079 RepID=UPI003D0B1CBF
MSRETIRLLYVDDDEALCRLVQKQLSRHGYDVDFVLHGRFAVERVLAGEFDVVALDHHMPGSDGLEILMALRELGSAPPVIYVTAAEESRIAIAALKAGAVDYVIKDVRGEFLSFLMVAIDAAIAAEQVRQAKERAEAEIRATRDRFEALADERGMLLREVNHRVGNSLQLIAALLRMQAQVSSSDEIKAALATAETRVMAVADVHRRLYASDSVKSINLRDYLNDLVADLQASLRSKASSSDLRLSAEPLLTPPDHAVAVGMIVTELVINAHKHAYSGGDGQIRIEISRKDANSAVLSVEDDGVGIHAKTTARSTRLGQTLLEAMAQKVSGALTYDARTRGTCAKIVFSLNSSGRDE